MAAGELAQYSIAFAIEIVNYYKWLVNEKKEYVMSKQILRSGTSIGANIHEANYAISKADFISKMQIAMKETAETEYWLKVLTETGFYDKGFQSLNTRLISIKKMLISTLNTTKREG